MSVDSVVQVSIRRPTRKSAAKRAAIVDSAAKLFATRGYAEVTLNDIAELADTKAGSMYYYFDSKDDLVEEVLVEASRRVMARVGEALASLPPDASPRDKIVAALNAHILRVARLDEYSVAHTRLFDQVPHELRASSIKLNREYANVWRGILNEARDAGLIRGDLDLTIVRQLVLGSISWMRHWYRPTGKIPPSVLIEHILALFFEGMGAEADKTHPTARRKVPPRRVTRRRMSNSR